MYMHAIDIVYDCVLLVLQKQYEMKNLLVLKKFCGMTRKKYEKHIFIKKHKGNHSRSSNFICDKVSRVFA